MIGWEEGKEVMILFDRELVVCGHVCSAPTSDPNIPLPTDVVGLYFDVLTVF